MTGGVARGAQPPAIAVGPLAGSGWVGEGFVFVRGPSRGEVTGRNYCDVFVWHPWRGADLFSG